MRLKFALLCFLLALLPARAFSESVPGSAPAAAAIVILGDSLSAAYGMQISESWPSLLQERLSENGYAYRVFNSSITGETTQGGLARLPRLLERHRPGVVILELGGNDGLRGIAVDVTERNLSSMIERSRAAGADVILAEMRIPPNYGRSYTQKFNGMYTSLADRHGVALLPFILQDIALEPGLMLPDGIHPTAQAQPLILDRVWSTLEPLLESP